MDIEDDFTAFESVAASPFPSAAAAAVTVTTAASLSHVQAEPDDFSGLESFTTSSAPAQEDAFTGIDGFAEPQAAAAPLPSAAALAVAPVMFEAGPSRPLSPIVTALSARGTTRSLSAEAELDMLDVFQASPAAAPVSEPEPRPAAAAAADFDFSGFSDFSAALPASPKAPALPDGARPARASSIDSEGEALTPASGPPSPRAAPVARVVRAGSSGSARGPPPPTAASAARLARTGTSGSQGDPAAVLGATPPRGKGALSEPGATLLRELWAQVGTGAPGAPLPDLGYMNALVPFASAALQPASEPNAAAEDDPFAGLF